MATEPAAPTGRSRWPLRPRTVSSPGGTRPRGSGWATAEVCGPRGAAVAGNKGVPAVLDTGKGRTRRRLPRRRRRRLRRFARWTPGAAGAGSRGPRRACRLEGYPVPTRTRPGWARRSRRFPRGCPRVPRGGSGSRPPRRRLDRLRPSATSTPTMRDRWTVRGRARGGCAVVGGVGADGAAAATARGTRDTRSSFHRRLRLVGSVINQPIGLFNR